MATITEDDGQKVTQQQQQQQESALDAAIERAKKDLEQLFAKRKQVIQTLGRALEKTVVEDPSEVCGRIKAVLKGEIARGLITARDIERYCHEKWKKKTRPRKNNDKTSIPEEKEASNDAGDEVQKQHSQPDDNDGGNTDESEEDRAAAAAAEEEDLIDKIFTIPAEKFGEVIEAMRTSKNGCLLQFNTRHELARVQAD